jgi:UDP-GlcNAc:undecaprenyl-phosphate GlcNAc-1-phosphate transferase
MPSPIPPILLLIPATFLLALALTAAVRHLAPRFNFVDNPGHRKIHRAPIPLGGGIAIFHTICLPLLLGAVLVNTGLLPPFLPLDEATLGGIRQQTPMLLAILLGALILHITGLIDDRRALGPYSKLLVQLAVAIGLVSAFPTLRLLTALGPAISITVTVLWIVAITNAMNFLDNMDGLSAGIAAVASATFLILTLLIGQWFVAAALACLLGACLGFLVFNRPPASIFMGDSGSLVLGYFLAVLTVRTTFLPPGTSFDSAAFALFMPVLVLAVPLYDLIVVSIIRISRGKSPFHGDTNHFSHRLVAHGFSKPAAVAIIWLITAATSLGALILVFVNSWLGATLVFTQTLILLAVVRILESRPPPPK